MEQITKQEEGRIRLYFRVSVFLKGAVSVIEVVGGILVLFVPISYFANFVVQYAQRELIEDQNDFIAIHLMQFAHQFLIASSTFIAVYLLSRGLIKLWLVIALLKNQLWAYPISLAVLGLFVIYQAYQIVTSHSLFITGLTLFDFIVIWAIWEEYGVMRAHLAISR